MGAVSAVAEDDGMTGEAESTGTPDPPPDTGDDESDMGDAVDSSGGTSTDDGSESSSDGTTGTPVDDPTYPSCPTLSSAQCNASFPICASEGSLNMCTTECGTTADCPAPDGGTAVPYCENVYTDWCVLDCTGNATCPTGMYCVDFGVGVNVCAFSA